MLLKHATLIEHDSHIGLASEYDQQRVKDSYDEALKAIGLTDGARFIAHSRDNSMNTDSDRKFGSFKETQSLLIDATTRLNQLVPEESFLNAIS